jgi:hypothetical protein
MVFSNHIFLFEDNNLLSFFLSYVTFFVKRNYNILKNVMKKNLINREL